MTQHWHLVNSGLVHVLQKQHTNYYYSVCRIKQPLNITAFTHDTALTLGEQWSSAFSAKTIALPSAMPMVDKEPTKQVHLLLWTLKSFTLSSSFISPSTFLHFSVFCCSLLPESFCLTSPFTSILQVILFNQYQYPKSNETGHPKKSFRTEWWQGLNTGTNEDSIHQLGRAVQVTICRLRTRHCHLLSHFYRLKISHSDEYPCGSGSQNPLPHPVVLPHT